MIHLLIYDEAAADARELTACLAEAFGRYAMEIQAQCCRMEKEFLPALAQNVDMVFIDPSLQSGAGFRLAQEIRGRRMDVEIVFYASDMDAMAAAFAFRPIGYILKSDPAQIEALVNRYMQYYHRAPACYGVSTRERAIAIPIREIRYFESSGHRVLVHCDSEDSPVCHNRRLDDIAHILRDQPFLRIHKSYLAHIDAVDHIDRANMQLILKSGERLPISRSNLARAVERFLHLRSR